MQDLEKCQFLALLREFEWFSFLTILFSTFLSFAMNFGWRLAGGFLKWLCEIGISFSRGASFGGFLSSHVPSFSRSGC
ncbi:hypothetical protein ACJV2T_03970 [Gardnerella sp. Marseille-Q9179]|uniref:hypothetical protein n=1 Tax=Gardnerella sp. Marseille-Q9179 TaxID=3383028 RepID=UPI003AF6C389